MRQDFLFPKLNVGMLTKKDMENLVDVLDKNREQLIEYIKNEEIRIRKDDGWMMAYNNFKDEYGNSWEMSPGEFAIYDLITTRSHKRSEVISSTQYGKTYTVSRGVLTRIASYPEPWMVIVPDMKRGKILLDYIINDTIQNDYFAQKLTGVNIKERTALHRLLEEKSRLKLTYQIIDDTEKPKYGSIALITADARRKQQAITSIMGFGGRNIIADESSLVVDEINSGVFRMLAGKGEDTFFLKIGNPFNRNHFLDDWQGNRYMKVYVDYIIGLAEGRYIPEFIEEAREKKKFDVLFECRFPAEEAVDEGGWMKLLTETEIKAAMQPGKHFGEEKLGCDPADEGTNNAAIVKRSSGYAEILYSESSVDPVQFAGPIIQQADTIISEKKKIFIDKVGVGAGTVGKMREIEAINKAEMRELNKKSALVITAVNAGETPTDKMQYANKRAEMYWRLRKWIKAGGILSNDERWLQLAEVPYQSDHRGRLVIMSKAEMRKIGIESPDEADALALTFYHAETPVVVSTEDKFFYKKMMKEKMRARRKRKPGFNLRMTNY